MSLTGDGGHLGWRIELLDVFWKPSTLPSDLLPSTIHAKLGLNWPSGFREDKNDECHWMTKVKKEDMTILHHSLDLPIINDLNKYFLLNSVSYFMECRLINTITSLMLIVNKKRTTVINNVSRQTKEWLKLYTYTELLVWIMTMTHDHFN